MLRSWWPPAMFAVSGILLAVVVQQVVPAVAFLVLALIFSPLIFPRSLTNEAARQLSAADGRPIVYWRPGCQYCLRLRLRLGRSATKVHWVNIWKDPEGAAAVRAIADGNETVPTVVAGGEAAINPDPAWLLARVR